MKRIILITTSLAIILLFLSTVTFAADFRFKRSFQHHTLAGPYDVSGLTANEAKEKLASDVTALHDELDLQIAYLDKAIKVPKEIVAFNVEKTIEEAESGKENPLYATISPEGLEMLIDQQFDPLMLSDTSILSIKEGIEKEMQSGVFPQVVHLTDYIIAADQRKEVVAESIIPVDGLSAALAEAAHVLDGWRIDAHQLFSLTNVLDEGILAQMTDEELTVLASGLYRAVLQTNFVIEERAISNELPLGIDPGFEAAVNRRVGIGFSYRNPNKAVYTLHADVSGGKLHISIEGLPFIHTYEPYIERLDTFPARTVKQFSAFIGTGQVNVKEQGQDGLEAIVQRYVLEKGSIVDTESISKDFYAPMPRIELHPLQDERSSDSSQGSSLDPNNNPNDDDGSAMDPGVTAPPAATGDGVSGNDDNANEADGQGSTSAGSSSGVGSSNDANTGTENTGTDADKAPIYDKSGMPIKK